MRDSADRTLQQPSRTRIDVFDLGCLVPYYTGPLCQALRGRHPNVRLLSTRYHHDVTCFERIGLHPDPGCIDIVAALGIRHQGLRRLLKSVEYCVNLSVLAIRLYFDPPAILHGHLLPFTERGLPFECWFLQLLKRRGACLVQTVHNDLPHDTGLRFKAAFTRLYRMADALICHTAQSRERMAEEFCIPLRKIHVIPHGPMNMARSDPRAAARVRSQFGISADTVMVLCQGFIRPYKGIAFLLEAWRRLQGRRTNARLIIAGGGDPELIQSLKFQAKGCGIESTVHFATYFLTVDDLGAFYQAADILVYPYRAITMSGSLMTGVTFRRPIVATKLPAFEQMLQHGETALLIDYGDVEGMADALGHLIEDPAERRRLGEAAGTVASSQSWEEIGRATLQCYEGARNLREP